MPKIIILISFTCFLFINCLAQRNPTAIYGTVVINDNTSMKATETNLAEWMIFIINNNFDSLLFPDEKYVSTSAKLLFDD